MVISEKELKATKISLNNEKETYRGICATSVTSAILCAFSIPLLIYILSLLNVMESIREYYITGFSVPSIVMLLFALFYKIMEKRAERKIKELDIQMKK